MTNDRHSLQLLEQANPVPDPQQLHVEPNGDRYLSKLLASRPATGGDTSSRRPTIVVWALCAALAALLVGGVVLIGTRDDRDVNPVHAPTPTPAPTVEPTTPPEPATPIADVSVVQSGDRVATVIGDIAWTRVDGDASSLPQSIDFESDGTFYGSDYDGTSWRSDDAVSWTEIEPLPGEPGAYVTVGDDVWTAMPATSSDGLPALGRWNGAEFVPVDLPDIEEPEVAGLRPTTRSLRLTAAGDQLAVIASTKYEFDPNNDSYTDVDLLAEWVDDQTVRVLKLQGGTTSEAQTLTVTPDPDQPDRLQVTAAPAPWDSVPDSSPGPVVGHVGPWPGLDASELLDALRNSGLPSEQILLTTDGSAFEVHSAPDAGAWLTYLAGVDDALLAVTTSGRPESVQTSEAPVEDPTFSLWSSRGQSSWEAVEFPDTVGTTYLYVQIDGNGTSAILTIAGPSGLQAWLTDDAVTWQPSGSASHVTIGTEIGWVLGLQGSTFDIEVSADGVDWQHMPLGRWSDTTGSLWNVVGDTIVISKFTDARDRTIWLGAVSPG